MLSQMQKILSFDAYPNDIDSDRTLRNRVIRYVPARIVQPFTLFNKEDIHTEYNIAIFFVKVCELRHYSS